MSFRQRLWAIAVVVVPIAFSQPSAAPKLEVASVKLLSETELLRSKPDSGGAISGNRISVSAMSVAALVRTAYNVRVYQISGGPGWIDNDRYDIAAKAEGDGILTPDQARQLFQLVLADRFQLTFHRETRDLPIYQLVVVKNGPRLKVSDIAKFSMRFTPGPSQSQLTVSRGTMQQLCVTLSSQVGAPVMDMTGLAGGFDFKLEFVPENLAADPSSLNSDAGGPSIFRAVEEQLGLKLKSSKGAVEVLVIDRVERPTDN
jgi:uncharacterized protein (TIGR03435 family)